MVVGVVQAVQERLQSAGMDLEAQFLDLDADGLRERVSLVRLRVEAELTRADMTDDLLMFRLTVEFPTGVGDSQTGLDLKGQRSVLGRRRPYLRQLSETLPKVEAYLGGEEADIESVLLELMVDPRQEG
jgi:hypothetical protein